MINTYCELRSLTNESDVEQFFVIRLLRDLGYADANIKTKTALGALSIGRGSKKEQYKPDYVIFIDGKPKIVLDAKAPSERIDDYVYQVSGYALGLNRKFKEENPVRYSILTNGLECKVYHWDEELPVLVLSFAEFVPDNPKFQQLKQLISFESLKGQSGRHEFSVEDFFRKPSVAEVISAFNKCHKIIWKKEKISPTDAFYEFTKIVFVKLDEDKRIRTLLDQGKPLARTDFKFSIDWLSERESETDNPLSSILFTELLKKLQLEIELKQKKMIFRPHEGIELKSPTIREVVKVLQGYDLYTIDEDLNGRMFETFLNATIRGRELGQYFTPRKVVKFMTKLANLQVRRVDGEIVVDSVLDACCGTGGFLIDAMADLMAKYRRNPALAPYAGEIESIIKTKSIYGIDANLKLSRIARINMYAHGDGGSRIYCADSLDKTVTALPGVEASMKRELEELRGLLLEQRKKFDVVLTNPPFSMTYSSNEPDEQVILSQYASAEASSNLAFKAGTTDLKSNVKSNVLFVARYHDLLEPGGRLLIILDNSVLNSYNHKEYRDYIRRNFLIKAVFQLPTHTFVNQEAGGITSILYLEKRESGTQVQPAVFARVITHVGHGTSGKEEARDDFEDTLAEYRRYELEGKLYQGGTKPIGDQEDDALFLIPAEAIADRIDVYFNQPSYRKLLRDLRAGEAENRLELRRLNSFAKVPYITGDKSEDLAHYRYFEIAALDKERGLIELDELEEGQRSELPDRAKLLVGRDDLLFARPFRSLAKVVVVPPELDGALASSGFYGIRCRDHAEAVVLWGIFRSNLIQKQLFHLSSGYTQRELNDNYLHEYLLIPLPLEPDAMYRHIEASIKQAETARRQEVAAIKAISQQAEGMVGRPRA